MCGSAVLSQTRGDPNTEADHGGKMISQGFIVGEMGNEDGRKDRRWEDLRWTIKDG